MRKKVIIIAVVLILCCGIILSACSGTEKLKKVYDDIVEKHTGELYLVCLKIADDHSYLTFDSNPYDSEDYYVPNYWKLLDDLMEALDVPSYVEEEMNNTTWSLGKQTAEIDGYVLTWTYHPDMGIEILCRVK